MTTRLLGPIYHSADLCLFRKNAIDFLSVFFFGFENPL